MNIYYRQRQNNFALFNKRQPRIRGRYILGALVLLTVAVFGYWKYKQHHLLPQRVGQPTAAAATATVATSNEEATLASGIHNQNSEQPANNTDNTETVTTQEDSSTTHDNATATNKGDTEKLSFLTKSATDKTIAAKATQTKDHPANAPKQLQAQVVTIKPHDNLARIFSRMALPHKEIDAILKSGHSARTLKKLQPGKKLTLVMDNNHSLQQLSFPITATETLMITRSTHNKFRSEVKTLPLETHQSFAKFTVRNTVLASGKTVGLNQKRMTQLANIFKSNVDFNKGSHSGDKVYVLYQDYYLNGKKTRDGEIIAAEYKTRTNTFQAVRFTDPKGNSGYYAPDGTSMQKRFLAAPVKFTHITSLFNPRRWHPILHQFRHHEGVDYAAPHGTPIKSVASGTIAHLGRKGGYGNAIIIQHDTSYSTLYGHLSKYASGLKRGSHVQQGQLIGYVGSTGLATGPHLHFEFRINGVHRNPLTVALPNGKSITRAYRGKFHAEVKKLLAKLDAHKQTRLAAKSSKESNS
jgi:murein DD-endopeptidase MepM/ murein hydrolase activator NlpD